MRSFLAGNGAGRFIKQHIAPVIFHIFNEDADGQILDQIVE